MLSVACLGNAAASEVVVQLAADKIDADPLFSVSVNGTEIGSGTMPDSYETTQGHTFVTDAEAKVKEFVYEAPTLKAGDILTVAFLNDKYDEERRLDANLYVISVAVDGRKLENADSRIHFPDGRVTDSVLEMGAVTIAWTAAAEYVVPEVPCEAKVIAITAISNGTVELDAAGKAQLDALGGGPSSCIISVTGYSSSSGNDATNLAVASARAENAADYLAKLGYVNVQSKGFGETDQFGPNQADNRRVIVEFGATK